MWFGIHKTGEFNPTAAQAYDLANSSFIEYYNSDSDPSPLQVIQEARNFETSVTLGDLDHQIITSETLTTAR
jgi:hypothetical protein